MTEHPSEISGDGDAAPVDLRIVLVGTQHPGNIGSAARAMKTMGLSRLVLVAPERYPHGDAVALAAGADDVLAAAQLHPTLDGAIAECGYVLGCTARQRGVALDEFDPAAGAKALLDAARCGPVALLFGRERSGLSNDELKRCHAAIHIPAVAGYSSLNLAAAVQVLCYEIRLERLRRAAPAATHAVSAPTPVRIGGARKVADQAQLEGFFQHLGTTLDAIDFHKGRSPRTVMQRLRRLFLRADMDAREVRILRGVFADAQRMARLAGEAGAVRQAGNSPVSEDE